MSQKCEHVPPCLLFSLLAFFLICRSLTHSLAQVRTKFTFEIESGAGTLRALGCWFKTAFRGSPDNLCANEVMLDTSPHAPETHWGQQVGHWLVFVAAATELNVQACSVCICLYVLWTTIAGWLGMPPPQLCAMRSCCVVS